ncbi:MAG: ATP-dependent helicase [bacterium]|nr:ATP-dependent helicase [bacterium]
MKKLEFTTEQQVAIETIEGIVCLSAGPGCGKTFVLVNRYIFILKKLLNSGLDFEDAFSKVLAVTFTRKAAYEMRERISIALAKLQEESEISLGNESERIKHLIRISTIDGWASSFLKEISIQIDLDPDFELVDITFAKTRFLEMSADLFDRYDLKGMEFLKRPHDLLIDIFHFIGQLKSRLITPDKFLDRSEVSPLSKFIADIYHKFDAWMRSENYFVFADLLLETYRTFQEYPAILKEYARGIEYLLIDEYQDLNNAQDIVLRMLSVAARQERDKENYFLVGDIGQSIYGFRDANYRNMLDYRLRKSDSSLNLSRNFRSNASIVEFINRFFDLPLYQKLSTKADLGAPVNLILSDTVEEEAQSFANEIELLVSEGALPEDIKILFRSMSNVWTYVAALEKYEIPFIILGASAFGRRPETLDFLSIFRLTVNVQDTEAFARLLLSPIFGYEPYELAVSFKEIISSDTVNAIIKDFQAQKIHTLELFEYILEKLEYFKYIQTLKTADYHRQNDTIEKMRMLLRVYERDNLFYSVLGFLDFFANQASEGFPVFSSHEILKPNAVTLMTVHASKGLEFPVVFVAGASVNNRQPLLYFDDDKGLILKDSKVFKLVLKDKLAADFKEEEERIFYVAVTRAKKKLFLGSYLIYGKYNKFVEKILSNKKLFENIVSQKSASIFADKPRTSNIWQKVIANVVGVKPQTQHFYDAIAKPIIKKIKYFYSVSELELYKECPYKYYLKKELKIPTDNSSANFGNAVHEFLETRGECGQNIFPILDEKVQKFLVWFNAYDWQVKNIIALEQNFSWKIGERFVRGTIDRVDDTYPPKEEVVRVLDYKTSSRINLEKYIFSMNVYREAYQAVFNKKVVEMILIYPMIDKGVEIPVDHQDVKSEVQTLITNIESEKFFKDKSNCFYCELKDFCLK